MPESSRDRNLELISSESSELVAQGVELVIALGDADLYTVLLRDCRIESGGGLLPIPALCVDATGKFRFEVQEL